ncbi:LLM class F420-dependent oxidoreductase [Nocardia panacis]|uniref:LLM class F420-dependent oxidoreductase n=1 Tax=Nocardia panacis TaxID=2340916 RepID=A0A3A4KB45_9NOCA|nr:LLM class F420-dependent oxidoreductase [Nocardia panacis]RJO70650.1 LLM class F420-dependent oxidoreductase [Nocardia panacis]
MTSPGTAPRRFRFGVVLVVPESRDQWIEKCRRAEEFGYDVIGIPDHLGIAAPFPAMMLAASVTSRVRITSYVLNVPFYNPVLLARDVTGTDLFTGGRIELGLGAGYVKAEFDAAGIEFGSGGRRVRQLAEATATLRKLFADPEFLPRPVQPGGPPLFIAGWGDKLLRVAAENADIIGLTGANTNTEGTALLPAGPIETGARIDFLRGLLGARFAEIELNLLVQKVVSPSERAELVAQWGPLLPEGCAPEEAPILLIGTPEQQAERLRAHRERFGFSYFTVREDNMEKFAHVVELLRGQ